MLMITSRSASFLSNDTDFAKVVFLSLLLHTEPQTLSLSLMTDRCFLGQQSADALINIFLPLKNALTLLNQKLQTFWWFEARPEKKNQKWAQAFSSPSLLSIKYLWLIFLNKLVYLSSGDKSVVFKWRFSTIPLDFYELSNRWQRSEFTCWTPSLWGSQTSFIVYLHLIYCAVGVSITADNINENLWLDILTKINK